MTASTFFIDNRYQAVRPSECVKRVQKCAVGNERIISPVNSTWDSFFLSAPQISKEFLRESASQLSGRQSFE